MDRDFPQDSREREMTDREGQQNIRSRGGKSRERTDERQRSAAERPSRQHRLSDTERQTMAEIGRFRTLSIEDLARHRHNGDSAKMGQDIRELSARGLVQTRSVWLGREKDRLVVVALTRQGKKALEKSGEPGTFYAGFVKPTEMAHDAGIYRVYQAEAARITRQGGEIRRITLDYELKRKIYSPLAKEKPGSPEYKKRQKEIAAEHNLKIVRGHIQLPDLRIEYRTSDGEIETTDLELATHHYRGGQLAAKAEAGFKFYAPSGDQNRLSSVFDDHHITAEIFWL
jgi:DNA-binding MarR family transcriptional regulator